MAKAVGYLRTSSAAGVGGDRDSEPRQRTAIQAFAERAGHEVVDWFYDAAVSGSDHLTEREGFASLLARIDANGVRIVLVEHQDRFARDLMVQETGLELLRARGVQVFTADGFEMTVLDKDPTRMLVRQLVGAVAQFMKAQTVARLQAGRRRTGRFGGNAPIPSEVIAATKRLAHPRGRAGKRSLREIAAELAAMGHLAPSGKPYGAESVRRMLGRR